MESRRIVAGKASGKRTLVDLVDEDTASKKKHRISGISTTNHNECPLSSRFFAPNEAHSILETPAKSLTSVGQCEKENIPVDEHMIDPVSQEDGYLSPSTPISRDLTPDLSSPPRSRSRAADFSDNKDVVSSPENPKSITRRKAVSPVSNKRHRDAPARVLVRNSSEPPQELETLGPDLSTNFCDDQSDTSSSEIGCWDEEDERAIILSPSPSLSFTPPEPTQSVDDCEDIYFPEDDDIATQMQKAANLKVARGWRSRYSFGQASGSPNLNDSLLVGLFNPFLLDSVIY